MKKRSRMPPISSRPAPAFFLSFAAAEEEEVEDEEEEEPEAEEEEATLFSKFDGRITTCNVVVVAQVRGHETAEVEHASSPYISSWLFKLDTAVTVSALSETFLIRRRYLCDSKICTGVPGLCASSLAGICSKPKSTSRTLPEPAAASSPSKSGKVTKRD